MRVELFYEDWADYMPWKCPVLGPLGLRALFCSRLTVSARSRDGQLHGGTSCPSIALKFAVVVLQVVVLVRVEVETQAHRQFQVTVASPDGQIAPAVLRLLCLHLAGSPSA